MKEEMKRNEGTRENLMVNEETDRFRNGEDVAPFAQLRKWTSCWGNGRPLGTW